MNQQHPIEGLMRTALENISDMVDVSTVIGEPIDAGNGLMMIPICKVSCGFVAGGSEFLPSGVTLQQSPPQNGGAKSPEERPVLPFGGGSSAGVGVTPVGFLAVSEESVRLIPIDNTTSLVDRLSELAPKAIEKLQSLITGKQAGSQKPENPGKGIEIAGKSEKAGSFAGCEQNMEE